jgi:maspardin
VKAFDALYADVPDDVRGSLARFRQERKLRRLRVDELVWSYVSFGFGERAVVFLHGMAGAYDIWWQQLEALADRYRVLSLTYPPVPTLSGLRRGVLAVVDAEGIDRFSTVGSSLGGYLAQYLVAHDTGRIDRAVFGNTFPPNDMILRENARTAAIGRMAPERLVMHGFRRSVDANVVPAAGGSPLVRAFMYEQSHGMMSKAQFLARYRCVVDRFEPTRPTVPVLIIESDNDPLVNGALRGMLRQTYPSARVHTFHRTGHFTYLNEPGDYTRVLAGFLDATA